VSTDSSVQVFDWGDRGALQMPACHLITDKHKRMLKDKMSTQRHSCIHALITLENLTTFENVYDLMYETPQNKDN